MWDADYTRLDAYDGCLHLYRLDTCIEVGLVLNEECLDYDNYALCSLLTWGGVPVEEAKQRAESFAEWWNAHDVSAMIEGGDDCELRDMLKPFRDAGACAEIVGLRWELG